ncbi:MAG: hypothetical protein JSW48_08555 [Betaproteobacteria bacterium]|nr:MAG: hypothetical protein JSW48_08555 [Betaproteobacteria bacterium]
MQNTATGKYSYVELGDTPLATPALWLYRASKQTEEVSVMVNGELIFPIETAFMAIVLPVIFAYLLLIAAAASGLNRDEVEQDAKTQPPSQRKIR